MNEAVVSTRTYFVVWLILILLLAVTVGVAYIHLGWLNPIAALSIAFIKALIIALYFMHVRSSPRLVWIFASAGVLWLAIMFVLTLSDYFTRGYLPTPSVWQP